MTVSYFVLSGFLLTLQRYTIKEFPRVQNFFFPLLPLTDQSVSILKLFLSVCIRFSSSYVLYCFVESYFYFSNPLIISILTLRFSLCKTIYIIIHHDNDRLIVCKEDDSTPQEKCKSLPERTKPGLCKYVFQVRPTYRLLV